MPGHLLLRLCLRLQPPPPLLPRLPPPRGIVANPPSFPPPSARGRLGNPQPSPGASASGVAGARAQGVECAPCPGRRAAVRKCRPPRNHGVHAMGEGDPELFGKQGPQAGRGWSPSLCAPCPGFSGRLGGGATPSRLQLSRNPSCHSGRGLGTQVSKPLILQLGKLRSREKEGFLRSQSLKTKLQLK